MWNCCWSWQLHFLKQGRHLLCVPERKGQTVQNNWSWGLGILSWCWSAFASPVLIASQLHLHKSTTKHSMIYAGTFEGLYFAQEHLAFLESEPFHVLRTVQNIKRPPIPSSPYPIKTCEGQSFHFVWKTPADCPMISWVIPTSCWMASVMMMGLTLLVPC